MCTGVIEHDVELAELLDGVINGSTDFFFVGDVAVDEGGGRADVAADGAPEFVLDVGDDHFCPVLAEESGGALADAAGAAGDQSNLTL